MTIRSLIPAHPLARLILAAALFTGFTLAFFALNGKAPFELFWQMILGAFGDSYSFSETLVKTAPILLCALAVALPARLGLVSVGGEGQLYFGALTGTGLVLSMVHSPGWLLMPMMVLAAAVGGGLWAAIPGLLKARMGVNETISTLLFNYVAVLLVNYAVHGPWKDPTALGWPASIQFPDAAVLPTFFDTRVHLGLVIGVLAAVLLHILATRSRWGIGLVILRSNQRVGRVAGISYERNLLLVMGLAGALAGIAGIAEASVIQGRLQAALSSGYGLSGFLVAWLAGQDFLRIIPMSLLIGALLSSADSLQLFAQLPAASATILQAALFMVVLAMSGRRRTS